MSPTSAPGGAILRIAVVGGGPAGSFFALYALKYARAAGREIAITIYEHRDFRQFGRSGCNMCAGIIPVPVLSHFAELDIAIPRELILGRIRSYALHTSAGTLAATQPDVAAEVVSVYRGAGPRYGHPPDLVSFDEHLLEEAISRGAVRRRTSVQAVRRGHFPEVVDEKDTAHYDLVVLATGVNNAPLPLEGFRYRPPPVGAACQTELYVGEDEAQRRLGSAIHIFLPPDEIAAYGVLIPKGPFVTVTLIHPRARMRSLRQFVALDEVAAVLGRQARWVCGCLPKVSIGPGGGVVDDGFVAVGDASSTRLYKNGIGSALATAQRAAWTVITKGCTRTDLAAGYLPLCRAIDADNRIGRLLFLQVPLLKHVGLVPRAHFGMVSDGRQRLSAGALHARVLWGMFTGTYPYSELLRMTVNPGLILQLALAAGRSTFHTKSSPVRGCPPAPSVPDGVDVDLPVRES
ncbi:MAG: hypothetical protein HY332_21200 [Chloroflexi bacterium]|nr:hypothetical protein [Chloroflexota bacterium]